MVGVGNTTLLDVGPAPDVDADEDEIVLIEELSSKVGDEET